jgi:peptidoglycan/xylan/chitin deacetylase (PgdA/CDA1 family)
MSGRVKTLSLDDLLSRPSGEDDAVAVTFDDGFVNTREAIGALTSEGVPVTLFVVSRQAGGTNAWGGREQRGIPTMPLLGWSDLEGLRDRGVSIEAHTRSHPHLTRVSEAELVDELVGGRDDLRQRLGLAVHHFAYPYGDRNSRVTELARRHFEYACTTVFDGLGGSPDPMALPRLDMYYLREAGALERWGSRAFLQHLARVRIRRRIRQLLPR